MTEVAPIVVTAMFLDDIRMEVGSKLSLMGMYTSTMALPEGALVDRISIFLYLRWHPDHITPKHCVVRIQVTGQPETRQEFPIVEMELPPGRTPFTAQFLNTAVQMRFPPLRVGDSVDVWADIDGDEYPAGRLRIVAAAPPALPVGAAIQQSG